MKIFNRKTKEYEEITQYGQGMLDILYHSFPGRILLKAVIHPVFSRMVGLYYKSIFSRSKVLSLQQEYKIDMSQFEKGPYSTFASFFTRKIRKNARPVCKEESTLIAPADSKLLVYPITSDLQPNIKGRRYTLQELLGKEMIRKIRGKTDLKDFAGGTCMVFRLTMDDYHRYCFVDEGEVLESCYIKGKLHTVSPVSSEFKVYQENSRAVSLLRTKNFGDILQIEVGALLVGKIVNHAMKDFKKGQEKGYFEPGGSTIVLLLKKNKVKADADILRHSVKGVEVKVQYGEGIGKRPSAGGHRFISNV